MDPKTRFVGALVLLGAPGAGKGTQSKLIAAHYGIPQISTGDLLRDNVARGTELGRIAKDVMARGEFVADDLVENMLAERVQTGGDTDRGFILDGFPRTQPQAEWLDNCLDEWFGSREQAAHPVVVEVVVDYNRLLRRITGRRTCPTCGRIYNIYSQPPRVDELCDIDGSKLVTRPDDREEVISERLKEYERKTLAVRDYYRAKGYLHEIDGDQSLEEVTGEIMKVLEHGDRL